MRTCNARNKVRQSIKTRKKKQKAKLRKLEKKRNNGSNY
jgi:hypothetical protein